MKPRKVREAQLTGDVATLRRMGRAGGRAAASNRRKLARMRDVERTFEAERRAKRHASTLAVIAERGGDPVD